MGRYILILQLPLIRHFHYLYTWTADGNRLCHPIMATLGHEAPALPSDTNSIAVGSRLERRSAIRTVGDSGWNHVSNEWALIPPLIRGDHNGGRPFFRWPTMISGHKSLDNH